MRSLRRSFFACSWLLLACCFALGCGVETARPRYDRPPIILFDIDTLRADHLGCYGYQRDTSPHIDRFASEAARFTWVFSQAPNTPPSQASILTGLYPSSHGRVAKADALPDEALTLAEVLSAAGYRSAALVDGGLMAAGFGMEQGFETYDDEAGGLEKSGPKALAWLEDHLSDPATAATPFFLLLHTYDVHSPYEISPRRFRDRYVDELEELPPEAFRKKMSASMSAVWKKRYAPDKPSLSDAEMQYAIAKYDAGIHHVDHWFGRLREALEKHGIYDQAILVILSDHGDTFQEHGSLFHEQIYSPVTRIPLIMRFPKGQHAGVYDPVSEAIDVMPTLLEAIGEPVPAMLQGDSLLPVLRGESGDGLAITEPPNKGHQLAVANSRLRLVKTSRGTQQHTELFEYRDDPLEQRDVLARYPEEADRMLAVLDRWRNAVEAFRFPKKSREDLDEETIQQLKTLGYID